MAKLGKWILAGGLGWVLTGGSPLGAILGLVVGSFFNTADIETSKRQNGRTTKGDFALSLIVLVAAVMKADGKVKRSELDYVKSFFSRSFGPEIATEAITMLRDLLKQNIPVQEVSLQIKNQLDYSSKLQMLHFLYGISAADQIVHPKEVEVIDLIASYMGILSNDRQSIKSMFVTETDSSYKILEISRSATEDEIKKAYREMAKKHHPDKVSYLGDDIKKDADIKFRKINDAYEKIKKERGFN